MLFRPEAVSLFPVGPMARKRKKTSGSGIRRLFVRSALAIAAASAAVFVWIWLTLPDVSGLQSKNPETTSLIELRKSRARRAGKAFAVSREWVDFREIPGLLKRAVLVSEDAAFYRHKGIDYDELKASIKKDIRERRFARGGSTITQQLAKNLYLTTEKTPWRKLREILAARRLEESLAKDRIFSLYLNLIELGPGIFGVQAASRRWFGKNAADLNLEEIVRLTAIIPRPLKEDPRKNTGWMKFKGRWIARTLKAVKAIGEEEARSLMLAFD